MSTEVNPNLPLEIAHVLFIDIVGYSKLLIDDQRELQQQLNQVVSGTEQFRAADASGKLVRLPTGVLRCSVFPEGTTELNQSTPGMKRRILQRKSKRARRRY
jgi:hypothetical protein